MAIFLKAYKGYNGSLTSSFERILVIFRYGLADTLSSRLFVAFILACLLHPVGMIVTLYGYHNLDLLISLDVNFSALPTINGEFFAVAMQLPQHFMLFFMVVFAGPIMISPDLRNNAMPLYLSRPINKSSYILGKLLVLIFLGSVISWIPLWIVFAVQSFLAGSDWLFEYMHIPVAALFSSMVWICCLSLIAFTISAFVKWKAVARIAFFGVFMIASIVGEIIDELFGGVGSFFVDVGLSAEVMIATLYDARNNPVLDFSDELTLGLALLQLLAFSVIALSVLHRRLRAYQVVS